MKFFIMYADSCVEDYAYPGDGINELVRGCINSEFQFLDRQPLDVELSETEGGLVFPDFILAGPDGCIPLMSEKMKRLMEQNSVDNLFYKRVYLTFASVGIREPYWLALPPRINCLDFENIKKEEMIEEDVEGLMPWERMREVNVIKIISSNVGNYKVFRLAEVVNQHIIVTEDLKNALEKEHLENLNFIDV